MCLIREGQLLLVLFVVLASVESRASSCELPPIEIVNATEYKLYLGFNLRSEEFVPSQQTDKSIKEFQTRNRQVHVVEAGASKNIKLRFGCGYGPSPTEFWFSYKVLGKTNQNVVKFRNGITIEIDQST